MSRDRMQRWRVAHVSLSCVVLLAGAAHGVSIAPIDQTRSVMAEYTDREGTPGGCIPGFCVPDQITSSETVVDEATAADFGPFEAAVAAGGASASATSHIAADRIDFAAHVSGQSPVLDFADSAADFAVRFELDEAGPFVLEGTLSRAIPPYVAGFSVARVWLEDGAGSEIADLRHPDALCPDISELLPCTPFPFLLEGTLAAGEYRIAAELRGGGSYYLTAGFEIPGNYDADLDLELRIVPEPGTHALVAVGLAITAAARRRRARGPRRRPSRTRGTRGRRPGAAAPARRR